MTHEPMTASSLQEVLLQLLRLRVKIQSADLAKAVPPFCHANLWQASTCDLVF
jgi:hypothetical protein